MVLFYGFILKAGVGGIIISEWLPYKHVNHRFDLSPVLLDQMTHDSIHFSFLLVKIKNYQIKAVSISHWWWKRREYNQSLSNQVVSQLFTLPRATALC